MSHPGSVDIIDFLAFTIYPFLALGIIELISRAIKIPSWKKLSVQGVSMIILSVIYVVSPSMIVTQENNTHVEPLWMSILVMLALAVYIILSSKTLKKLIQQKQNTKLSKSSKEFFEFYWNQVHHLLSLFFRQTFLLLSLLISHSDGLQEVYVHHKMDLYSMCIQMEYLPYRHNMHISLVS